MKLPSKQKFRKPLGFVFALLLTSLFWHLASQPKAELHRTLESPDGRHRILVFRTPLPFAMPGGGSDAPGYFQLVEVKTGKVLEESELETVQWVEQNDVFWSKDRVEVKLLADWKLPP